MTEHIVVTELEQAEPVGNTGAQFFAIDQADLAHQDHASVCLAIAAAGEATYRWEMGDDALFWSPLADMVLKRPPACLATGKHFASLLDPENLTSRYDTIFNSTGEDLGHGVAYHIEYRLKGDPDAGLAPMWVEDRGCWFANSDGRPQQAVGVLRPIDERHSRDQRLSELSHTDPLTGMMNRSRLDEALEESIGEARIGEKSCAFAVATIRNLDVVNEAYGFEVADEVIAAMAARLRTVMRTGDGIARYSGSKFGIILNSCKPEELPFAIERFLNVARDSVIETSHGPVWALLSMGAVLLPTHADNSLTAKALAEEALSTALRLSSDSYVIHQPSERLVTDRIVNTRCAAEIVECLKTNKFQLAFQPLIDAATGEVACHEALLRMRDQAGEFVTAAHLVPVAERLGLIRLVDRAVTQLALETLHSFPDARLSINLSATTANDARWNAQIIEMIQAAGPVANRLTVEITETTALTDLTVALDFLDRLRGVGCCVAIDDFGAGFTSFRNLRDLPVDIIKLDGSYCRNLAEDSENVYFARTLIEMAHHFGIRTVAEWVETESDAKILCDLGIDFLQGNHFGLPSVEAPWTRASTPSFEFATEPEESPAAIAVPLQRPVIETRVPAEQLAVRAAVPVVTTEVAANLIPPVEEADAVATHSESIEAKGDVEAADATTEILSEVQTGMEADGDIEADMETGLSKLKEALDLLNQQFGHSRAASYEQVETRLAS